MKERIELLPLVRKAFPDESIAMRRRRKLLLIGIGTEELRTAPFAGSKRRRRLSREYVYTEPSGPIP